MDRNLLESVAAISAEFHKDERFDDVYQEHGRSVGGFPGFYELVIDAAIALEKAVKKEKAEWGDQYDWPLSTEAMSDNIYSFISDEKSIPGLEELAEIAKMSLSEY